MFSSMGFSRPFSIVCLVSGLVRPSRMTRLLLIGGVITLQIGCGGSGGDSKINPTTTTNESTARTISFIQLAYATPQSAQLTVPVPFGRAQTSGNLNIVVVGWSDTTAAVSSVTDSLGNVYTLAVGPTTHPGSAGTFSLTQSIYFAKNIVGAAANANTVTVRFTVAAALADIRILEYTGIDPVNPVDGIASAIGTDAFADSGAVTTTHANDLLFGANTVFTSTWGAGTGFTSRVITAPDSDIAEDRVVSAVGSYSASAPLTGAGPWVMQMWRFVEPSLDHHHRQARSVSGLALLTGRLSQ
jgi:hypothetical protein